MEKQLENHEKAMISDGFRAYDPQNRSGQRAKSRVMLASGSN